MSMSRVVLVVALCVVFGGVSTYGQRGVLTATKVPTTIVTGTLADGTVYTLVKPDPWNGTLFVDLDSTDLNSDAANWLYARGIARAGNTRLQIGSLVNKGADDLVETLDLFTKRFGKPARALISGTSLGGQVGAVAAFNHPDRFAGAMIFCGGLMGWGPYLNTNLDAAFTVKTLIAPDADLPLVHVPEDNAALTERWQSVLKAAQATPQGRARIMLAVVLGQAPIWTTRDMPEPAANDTAGRQEAAYRTLADFGRQFTALRRRLEAPAGGATSWNTGVDYAAIYRNRVSARDRGTVEALYREAGIPLEQDLAALASAPRVAPEPGPIDFVRQLYPFDGRITMPIMTLSTTGDPYVWSSIDSAYKDAVQRAGRADLLRMTYVHSAGHCAFTNAERVAAYQVLLDRLDSGRWPETTPAAMNARATAVNLGDARYWDYTPPAVERSTLTP
jgi:pimeloyl-ACP methyl ester carboxylesterase